MRFPLLIRLAVVAAIALALVMPLSLIRHKVAERQARAHEVQKSFAEEASGPQVVAGPILLLTCEETYLEGSARRYRTCPTGLFTPSTLSVEASAPVEERYRGIYPIRLYRAQLRLSGAIGLPPQPDSTAEATRAWKDAFLVLAVSDVRGIREIRTEQLEFVPGTPDPRIRSGLHASLGRYASLKQDAVAFDIPVEMVGTTRLGIAPLARNNVIRIASGWPHPSFFGAYAPDQRDVGAGGFSAAWRVSHLATGGDAFWLEAVANDKLLGSSRVIGVSMIEPVNPYSMSYRATEYGFLFVLLTFALFALVELTWGVPLHPLHYALTGLALSVFFLLLLALSEHVRFGLAYLAAAGSCVGLLAFYLHPALGAAARSALFTGLFAALYGALYMLLKSEDHSLLLGAIVVFGMLAAVMLLTRRLDWTRLSQRLTQRPAGGTA